VRDREDIDGPLAQRFIVQQITDDGAVARIPLNSGAATVPLNGATAKRPGALVLTGYDLL